MKQNIITILVLVFCANINAQKLDTLFQEDGGMEIWHSDDLNKLREKVEKGMGALLTGKN